VAAALGCLLSAAPNLATVKLTMTQIVGWLDLAAMVRPLRQAAHLHTLRFRASYYLRSNQQQAAALEGVVRCLAQPGADGGDEYCRALRHVLIAHAQAQAHLDGQAHVRGQRRAARRGQQLAVARDERRLAHA
jgi:hypothetical protein